MFRCLYISDYTKTTKKRKKVDNPTSIWYDYKQVTRYKKQRYQPEDDQPLADKQISKSKLFQIISNQSQMTKSKILNFEFWI